MTRKNIFEILEEKYNIVKEMNRIVQMFEQIKIGYSNTYASAPAQQYSIEQIFDSCCFANWKQRGPYLSCIEMKADLPFPKKISSANKTAFIPMLEYYVNVITWTKRGINYPMNFSFSFPPGFSMLNANVDILLEHLNYEKVIFEQEQKVILVPKNPAVTAVAEITKDENIGFAILKYNHASLKGDLEGKRQLLLSIANEYEPLLKDPIDSFSDYFKKATFLLNNLNLRHNNKSGKDKKQFVVDMPNEELEKWYDELYQLLLFCVLIKDNVKRKNEIDELLKKLKKK